MREKKENTNEVETASSIIRIWSDILTRVYSYPRISWTDIMFKYGTQIYNCRMIDQ